MELKEINVDKIEPNKSQPREQFDKEKLQELAESILSNSLINPIIVRKNHDGYVIVAGERRWKATKLAGLKTIQAFVKEYKNEGEWMVESLIENVQRENLSENERAKYLKKIMKIMKIENITELSKLTKISKSSLSELFDVSEYRSRANNKQSSFTMIRATQGLEDKERKKIIEFAEKKEIPARQIEEKIIPIIKSSPKDVKEALLDDEINVEQAEAISRLEKPEQRKRAIKEHKIIKNVDKNIERNIKNQQSDKEKREFDKRVIQAKSWINSFRGSVTDSYSQLEKTIKILLIATKFIQAMDNKQKERLNQDLGRFLEVLNRATQVSEKIQEAIENE